MQHRDEFSEEDFERAEDRHDRKADRQAELEERHLDAARKHAQEEYIVRFAESKGMTVEQLESRLLRDMAAGAPTEKAMNILGGMYAACERVTMAEEGPFAPDYEELAQQEPTSQYQDSRESAGLA